MPATSGKAATMMRLHEIAADATRLDLNKQQSCFKNRADLDRMQRILQQKIENN